jgi:imidazolonepropionase-like amidohydrolase
MGGLRRPRRRALAAVLASVATATAAHAERPLAFRGARIHTVSGVTLESGVLVVRDGKIEGVGAEGRVAIPENARIRDLSGSVLIPGLVDTHSHIGVYPRPRVPANADGNETSDPIQAIARAIDAISPFDPGIRMALAGGVTTANIMPGSANVIGGQTAYVKLRGDTVESMLIDSSGISGGMKLANGENPKRSYGETGKAPTTRMALTALQRQAFVRAQEYQRSWEEHRAKRKGPAPKRDLALEPLVEILEGRRTVHFHTHRADDIMTALRLREEFGFDLVLQHATEAYKVADAIAASGVPASVIVLDSPGGKLEAAQFTLANAAILERAGVPVAIHSDDPITSSRLLLRSAALSVRAGMSEAGALRAISLDAARMLRLDGRLGSLEVGKDADFAVLSGPPFSTYTKVLETWIDGVRVFDRSDPAQRRYATGGYRVADRYPDPEARP